MLSKSWILLTPFVLIGSVSQLRLQPTTFRPATLMANEQTEPAVKAGKKAQRKQLYQLLGKLPDRDRPIQVQLISRQETDELITEKLLLDINGLEKVPAYFTRPRHKTEKLPVILFNHSHFGQYNVGKDEFVKGRSEMQKPPYALALARAGYAGLCIDSWCFGERQQRTEMDTFKEMLWHGQVLWGMMVYDNLRALDYLQTRSDVDSERIGTMGMSMGSTMAWWLAALDERIKVCVDLCCLTDYQSLIEAKGLGLHGIYYYVPDLLTHFTTSSINGLISPRPHFSLAGRFDPLTPLPGLEKIDQQLKQVYLRDGAPAAWRLTIYDVGHQETAAMRADILSFYAKWL
ncbi:dienelactone hydrolase family protein [Spirosoma sp. KNUC1025]|uniref:dienelactone hydrolase family protein n=1 Tax=Spirosoma sp. KNUC1025 TaxID=2894082 RepID=UPI003866D00C|nr:dienelactone hydrolase family protein [Spirosoma sp. KNUC1025]